MANLSDYDIDEIRRLLVEDDKLEEAELKLSGLKDRKDNFEFRPLKQDARCRGCREEITKGDKIIWASGNREAVIFCIPCVKALGRVVRNILE